MYSVMNETTPRADNGIGSVSVLCGSNLGRAPNFSNAAKNLGSVLAASGIRLIYGGVKTGLMGLLADSVLERGGQVIGVIPQFLVSEGISHDGLTELRIVESMSDRKMVMLDMSDATIVLPGGIGTQDEFWEVLAARQLGFHSKPIGIVNVDGYYDSLILFVDRAIQEGFISTEDRRYLFVSEDPEQLIHDLSESVGPGFKGLVG
jgi:uncharacterized protein (TIGR00730 family)